MATVVPCTTRAVAASSAGSASPSRSASSSSPRITPSDWSAGVLAALAMVMAPSGPMPTTSVKVPPTSMPIA